MHAGITTQHKYIRNIIIISFITVILFISVFAFANAETNEPENIAQDPISTFTFTLDSGDSTAPFFYFNDPKDINFSLAISGNSASSEATINVYNASSSNIWSDKAYDSEKVWGNIAVTKGNNTFDVENTGPDSLTFTLTLFDIPTIQAPSSTYYWAGHADPDGINSEIEIDFPVSGLYTFDFSVNTNERYEFVLGMNNIQRTVTSNDSVSLYVDADRQTVTIDQDITGNLVDWQVDITYSGSASDSLPYTKANDDIDDEVLPINLSAPAQVNMVITATGTAGDQLLVDVFGATPQLAATSDANISVYAGETTWTTFDFPAGTSVIEITTPDDLMDYEFEITVIPSADFDYTGTADADGQNSKIRLTFDTAGLYDFDFGNDNGRYQFMLNVDDSGHIQKTVETAESVTYYVPTGTHELIVDQDNNQGAEWGLAVSLNTASNDSLPYAKLGGEIGGTGNDFDTEWLPVSLSAAANVNMSINATGGETDSLRLEVYQSGDNTADYTLSQVLGSEEQWTNFQLSSGINRLKIVADDTNINELSYDLEISAVPTNGTMEWGGNVLDDGLNAAVWVDFPTAGLYRFNIDSSEGFANLILDDHMMVLAGLNVVAAPNFGTSYDLQVEAGPHEIYVVQDTVYANTTWTASVEPTTAGAKFFEFNGTLAGNESVTPQYPVPIGTRDFNFSFEVSGNNVDLEISNDGGIIWTGTALDGETLWGTGTLSETNDLMITNSSGASADVSLKLYDIPDAGYSWDGAADASGLNSEIRVNFPEDGLYEFSSNAASGSFQYLVNSEFIQKTEDGSSSVTYFVPAGTRSLKIDQETTSDTDWDLTISDVGDSSDSLPYTKEGGLIGGTGNDFDTEWLPINLSAATEVNIATTMTGTSGDSVELSIIDETNAVIDSIVVNADETSWMTVDLPVGTSRLEFDASGNTATAAYEVTVTSIPSAANYSWDGNAISSGENSHIRVSFPSSGVYSFTHGIDSGNGRYQFLVNDAFVQKTVEGNGSVAYYIPAGTHDLYIEQDSADGADWSLDMNGPVANTDSLPYAKMGGEIGSTGNDFTEEWLPVHVGVNTPVNVVVTITGDQTDAVSFEIWDASSQVETVGPVYGTESLWSTFTLPAHGRIHVIAAGSNNAKVSYEVTIIDIPEPTFSWNGTSLEGTENSIIQMDMQVGGTYIVEGDFAVGFASIAIDPDPTSLLNAPLSTDADFTMSVDLDAGMHTFVVMQGGFATSTWTYTVTLDTAYAPTISSVTPGVVAAGSQTNITINGANFLDGAVVTLIGNSNYPLTTTYVSGSLLTAVVPANVDIAMYDVQVTNPDTQSVTLTDGLEVIEYYIFLPIIIKD